jgi:hypothetical protein
MERPGLLGINSIDRSQQSRVHLVRAGVGKQCIICRTESNIERCEH